MRRNVLLCELSLADDGGGEDGVRGGDARRYNEGWEKVEAGYDGVHKGARYHPSKEHPVVGGTNVVSGGVQADEDSAYTGPRRIERDRQCRRIYALEEGGKSKLGHVRGWQDR